MIYAIMIGQNFQTIPTSCKGFCSRLWLARATAWLLPAPAGAKSSRLAPERSKAKLCCKARRILASFSVFLSIEAMPVAPHACTLWVHFMFTSIAILQGKTR